MHFIQSKYKVKGTLCFTFIEGKAGETIKSIVLGDTMFSEFVNFKELDLSINNMSINQDLGLSAIDISHDNKVYQIALTINNPNNDIQEITKDLNRQIKRAKTVSLKLNYELKRTSIPIQDLYSVIPDKNLKIEVKKLNNKSYFILNCQLKARNNIFFNYQADNVVNF